MDNKVIVSYPNKTPFSITIFGLDEPSSQEYNRRHCKAGLQSNSGDLAAGSRLRRDHEVEVPPCERGANPGRRSPGENRIWSADASGVRMPLEFVTDSFLPSETSARSNGFKKNSVAQVENQPV